jgi:hypothetical protein
VLQPLPMIFVSGRAELLHGLLFCPPSINVAHGCFCGLPSCPSCTLMPPTLPAMLLIIGSPALAAYSLALTVLGRWWMAQRFAAHNCPANRYATQIVSSLQQSPLTVTKTGSLLASRVVLPENDEWWSELAMRLDYTNIWSVTTA